MVRLNLDVVVVGGSEATKAMKEASRTIPIVFFGPSYPVEEGLVESFARPGGNITGITVPQSDHAGRCFTCSHPSSVKISLTYCPWQAFIMGAYQRRLMNNRRKLLVALGAGALAISFCAFAQLRDRPAHIATLSDADEDSSAPLWAMFRKRLHELGYVEGTSYVIESRWAKGDTERLAALAAELAALKPGVIVADGTPSALAAKQATVSIPIVAIRIADPVKAGLAASLARPGGNLTGTTIVTTNIAGKWLELLREVAPGVRSLAFLNDTSNAGAMLTFRELQEQARPLGVKVQALDGRNRSNVEQAFSAIARERMDGFVVGTNAVVFAQRHQIIEAAARQRLPAIYARREYVDAGGLMSYGTDLSAHYSHAADYGHRILQGAKPGDLPIEQPTKFELVLNLKTATTLGLTIPQSLLVRADEVIE
ncbi:MAG: hypothetical protein E6H73_05885 [Betaproteobacteria bacterium]|nr:MAG: hypothetical protein E6H73_05885 [Betaproteobacteria bacterium]